MQGVYEVEIGVATMVESDKIDGGRFEQGGRGSGCGGGRR